jgi:hypothetical protein
MRRLTDTGRALVLPADISIPEAYILGYKEAVEEFLADLNNCNTEFASQWDFKQLIKKWEQILDK